MIVKHIFGDELVGLFGVTPTRSMKSVLELTFVMSTKPMRFCVSGYCKSKNCYLPIDSRSVNDSDHCAVIIIIVTIN